MQFPNRTKLGVSDLSPLSSGNRSLPFFHLKDTQRSLYHRIRVKGDGVYPFPYKELCKLRVVAWGLAADPDLPIVLLCRLYD